MPCSLLCSSGKNWSSPTTGSLLSIKRLSLRLIEEPDMTPIPTSLGRKRGTRETKPASAADTGPFLVFRLLCKTSSRSPSWLKYSRLRDGLARESSSLWRTRCRKKKENQGGKMSRGHQQEIHRGRKTNDL